MERYRSGHNGADSKSVCAQAHEGSNPSLSAKKEGAESLTYPKKRKKADVLYQKVLSIRLLFGIIKSPNLTTPKARLIIHQ